MAEHSRHLLSQQSYMSAIIAKSLFVVFNWDYRRLQSFAQKSAYR
jgi:hypothetical protein